MARPYGSNTPARTITFMNRGQTRRNIFIEDKGRQTFLDLLNWAVTSMKRSAKRLD